MMSSLTVPNAAALLMADLQSRVERGPLPFIVTYYWDRREGPVSGIIELALEQLSDSEEAGRYFGCSASTLATALNSAADLQALNRKLAARKDVRGAVVLCVDSIQQLGPTSGMVMRLGQALKEWKRNGYSVALFCGVNIDNVSFLRNIHEAMEYYNIEDLAKQAQHKPVVGDKTATFRNIIEDIARKRKVTLPQNDPEASIDGLFRSFARGMGLDGDAVVHLFEEALERLIEKQSQGAELAKDPVTGLEIPPRPRTPYNLRHGTYGWKMSASEFLGLEWKEYTVHHLLYAEHIRLIDDPLYRALYNQARNEHKPFAAFLLENGVLAKEHILHPPQAYQRQAQMLRAVRLRSRAKSLESTASELEKV